MRSGEWRGQLLLRTVRAIREKPLPERMLYSRRAAGRSASGEAIDTIACHLACGNLAIHIAGSDHKTFLHHRLVSFAGPKRDLPAMLCFSDLGRSVFRQPVRAGLDITS